MKKKKSKIKILHPFRNITKAEWAVYLFMLLLSMLAATMVYSRSCAFYSTDLLYDVIYTSDSPSLMDWDGRNAFLALTHPENDLKQPLFAVFAAPFMVLPYLLGRLATIFSARLWFCPALFMDFVQIAMILCANLLLSEMLGLSPLKRVCFMVLLCCSYTYMLFILIIEQYAVSYFWLMIFLYLLQKKRADRCVSLHGAGGTLIMSLAVAPWASRFSPKKKPDRWWGDMLRHAFVFMLLIFLFRSDLFTSLAERMKLLFGFTGGGEKVTLGEKLCKFTVFLRGIFFAPAADPVKLSYYISWQQREITGPDIFGMAVFVLSVSGYIAGRDERTIKISAFWALLGFAVLALVGLGASENGMVLYSLYFGWAYVALVFRLLEEAAEKLKICTSATAAKTMKSKKIPVTEVKIGTVGGLAARGILIPLITTLYLLLSAAINLPGLIKMVRFAAENYPA